MIKLKNNYTTPEQSKRLQELGVPASSADCFYCDGEFSRIFVAWSHGLYSDPAYRMETYKRIPCWSTGRVMEIEKACAKVPMMIEYAQMDKLIKYLEIRINDYDFSKLNDK